MSAVESAEATAEPEGASHPRLLSDLGGGWWRPLLGLLLAGLVVVVLAVGVLLVAALSAGVAGSPSDSSGSAGSAVDDALAPSTPLGLLTNNLIIAAFVPAAVVAVLVVHRTHPGWLVSVQRRVRLQLLGVLLALALAVTGGFFLAGFLLPGSTGTSGDLSVPTTGTLVGLLLVIALTTPLQAAAEEVAFRGYLSQAVASWFTRPAVGIAAAALVSSALFALAHGGQDAALFGDRLAFGLVASWLAWRTGGLEAPVALHVANNLVSLAYSAVVGSLEASLDASTLPWQYLALDVAMMLVFAGLAVRVARARGEATHRVLSAAAGVGYPWRRLSTPPPAGNEEPWGMG